jgi:hypothetical protein
MFSYALLCIGPESRRLVPTPVADRLSFGSSSETHESVAGLVELVVSATEIILRQFLALQGSPALFRTTPSFSGYAGFSGQAGDWRPKFQNRQVHCPGKELRGFQRVSLKPGERRTVIFSLLAEKLAFYDVNKHDLAVEPRRFDIMIGISSAGIRVRDRVGFIDGEDLVSHSDRLRDRSPLLSAFSRSVWDGVYSKD